MPCDWDCGFVKLSRCCLALSLVARFVFASYPRDEFSGGWTTSYLYEYATDGGRVYETLEEAMIAALADPIAGGVTKEQENVFTVRKANCLSHSASGEMAWIKKTELIEPTGPFFCPAGNLVRFREGNIHPSVKKQGSHPGSYLYRILPYCTILYQIIPYLLFHFIVNFLFHLNFHYWGLWAACEDCAQTGHRRIR